MDKAIKTVATEKILSKQSNKVGNNFDLWEQGWFNKPYKIFVIINLIFVCELFDFFFSLQTHPNLLIKIHIPPFKKKDMSHLKKIPHTGDKTSLDQCG